jgi:N-carbamoyl-L-amino-acid hydrolase
VPPPIDPTAVLGRIQALAAIGRTPAGGVSRVAFSPADGEARRMLVGWCEELGLAVRCDAAGSLFGRWGPDGPALMLGSHIDSVPDGGPYDGCLGVAAALESVRALRASGFQPAVAVEVVSWQMEESSRFGQATFGSRVFAARLRPEDAARWRDSDGRTLADLGADPALLPTARAQPGQVAAYFELHIDQGVILRNAGAVVGAVTGIAAPLRVRLHMVGEASHSGAALPEQRHDALLGAARVLVEVEDLVTRERPWGTVATVGAFAVSPNAINVVPGEVEMGIDVRGVDVGSRRRLCRAILQVGARVAAQRGLGVSLDVLGEEEPVALPEAMTARVERAAAAEGEPCIRLVSLAGHDAMQVAAIAPAGLVLVRNISGTSHSPREAIAFEDLAAGCRVYHRAVCDWLGVP